MFNPAHFSARFGSLILLLLTFCSLRCQGQTQAEAQALTYPCIKTQPAQEGTAIQWTIHIKVALDSDKKIKYEACPFPTPKNPMPPGYCPESFAANNRDINLCTNDTVVWQVHTKNGAHGSSVLLQPDGLLGQLAFVAQEPQGSPPAKVGPASMPSYEYYVGAVDKDDQGHWYSDDDPKMIVGGSNLDNLVDIGGFLKQAKTLADALPTNDANIELRRRIEEALRQADRAEKVAPKAKPNAPK